jgi:hypothetical protein
MKPSELIERTKSDINKIFEKEEGVYICDFGVTNCAYSDKAFDGVMCEVSDLQDELDKRFIDREELKDKIYNLNKINYDEVNINGDFITSRIERVLYELEMFIYNNVDIQKKAFKDSKIIKNRIKKNKEEILELLK